MSTQTNTRAGALQIKAGESLVGKEGFLVKIVDVAGEPRAKLPEAVTDDALFVIDEGAGEGSYVKLIPLSAERNVRIRLKGAAVPGSRLCLAGSGDFGKVRALPEDSGTYFILAVSEEVGVDGQNLKTRPALIGNVTV